MASPQPAALLQGALPVLTAASVELSAVVVARGVSSIVTKCRWRRELIVVDDKRQWLRAPRPPPFLFVGNTPALTYAYYRTMYAHVAEPVSVFLMHATPFLFFNDLAAVQRVLSGGCASFM